MARVLVVEDEELLVRALRRHLRASNLEVDFAESLAAAQELLAQHAYDAVLLDISLPDGNGLDALESMSDSLPPVVIVMTGDSTVDVAIAALRRGASDYLKKPFELSAVDRALERAMGRRPSAQARPRVSVSAEDVAQWRERNAPEVLGASSALDEVFSVLARVADADCPILVHGETGSGKELIARAIHRGSSRAGKPFMTLNCAAIPENLVEAELFGHARGAFTGASQSRDGLFREAHQGTLFLDEIGELSLAAQAKLLRVLQEGEVTRIGESTSTNVDVRIVTATHRDLEAMVEEGTFRRDLFYRIEVVRVALPPLRARSGDVALLAERFVGLANSRRGRSVTGISPEAMRALRRYPWPGNVRQLENTIERMVLLRAEGELREEDVPQRIVDAEPAADVSAPELPTDGLDLKDAVDGFESTLIRQALERTGWNKNRAAQMLGLNRTTLVERLKRRGWLEPTG